MFTIMVIEFSPQRIALIYSCSSKTVCRYFLVNYFCFVAMPRPHDHFEVTFEILLRNSFEAPVQIVDLDHWYCDHKDAKHRVSFKFFFSFLSCRHKSKEATKIHRITVRIRHVAGYKMWKGVEWIPCKPFHRTIRVETGKGRKKETIHWT